LSPRRREQRRALHRPGKDRDIAPCRRPHTREWAKCFALDASLNQNGLGREIVALERLAHPQHVDAVVEFGDVTLGNRGVAGHVGALFQHEAERMGDVLNLRSRNIPVHRPPGRSVSLEMYLSMRFATFGINQCESGRKCDNAMDVAKLRGSRGLVVRPSMDSLSCPITGRQSSEAPREMLCPSPVDHSEHVGTSSIGEESSTGADGGQSRGKLTGFNLEKMIFTRQARVKHVTSALQLAATPLGKRSSWQPSGPTLLGHKF